MFSSKNPPGFYIETIHKEYTEKDPVFFDTQQFIWAHELEMKTQELIRCLMPVMTDDFAGLTTNPEERFQLPPKIWKGFPFYFNGFRFRKNLRDYPVVARELKKIPNLISASVSVLEPGAHLLPHNGNSNGVMRYHLGLNIPASMPDCGLIIGGHEVSWEAGKSFMFCNMSVHSAHNKTAKRRHILMLDVVRPEFVSIKKKICIHSIAKILTNDTAEGTRKMFGIKPHKVSQEPTKGLIYEDKDKIIKKQNTSFSLAAWALTMAESITLKIYIFFLSTIFLFKKLQ